MNLLTVAEAHPVWAAISLIASGTLLATLGKIPGLVWDFFVRMTTVQLEVEGSDPSYPLFNQWLARHAGAAAASTFVIAAHEDKVGVAPGFGTHLLWQDRKLLLVQRTAKQTKSKDSWNESPQEAIKITALGLKSRGRVTIGTLVETIHGEHQAGKGLAVRVWHFGYWFPLTSRINRPLSSVFLSEELKSEIVGRAEWFFGNEKWFADRGIPYRCGFLFKGPPGTGKSSTVCAMGTHFNRPVCMMNLTTIGTDNDLLNAFIQAPRNAIILIEDVDAMDTTATRKKEEKPGRASKSVSPDPAPQKEKAKGGISLSGLLNAIDGVAAPEGRLLVLTTNHPEKLDKALLRKARVDKEFTLDVMTPDLVEKMAERFFPDDPDTVAAIKSKADLGPNRAAAEWQGEFMDRARGV